MNLICFDAETTDRGELLELSVYNISGNEIYHSYFKPVNSRRWRTDIHHITPEMVAGAPTAKRELPRLQSLADTATHLLGFAVDNDIRILSNAGVKNLDSKSVIEVRQWYWLCVGREKGDDINGGPGLGAVAAELGVGLSDTEAHSASADTAATLQCFKKLLDIYIESFMPGTGPGEAGLPEVISHFEKSYRTAREEVMRLRAHGNIYIALTPKGHKFMRSRPASGLLLELEVEDRYTAELDFHRLFANRRTPGFAPVYNLKPSDLDRFSRYSNSFSLEQYDMSRKLLALTR